MLTLLRHILSLAAALLLLTACHSAGRAAMGRRVTKAETQVAEPTLRKPNPFQRTRRFNELFLEALRQKEQDHLDAAYELLEAALDIHPDASEALYELGTIKLGATSYSDTLSKSQGYAMLQRAAELEPDNLYYKETWAAFLANNAQFREAIRLYEDIAEAEPNAENLSTLVWLYSESGDYAGVIRSIERIEQIEGRSEQLSIEKFHTFIAMKDTERAYRTIEELCAEFPLDLRFRVLLGDLYDRYGYHEQALRTYLDVLTAEPENSYAQLSLLAYYKAAEADSLYLDLLHRVVLNPKTQGSARNEALRSYIADNLATHADSTPVIDLLNRATAMQACAPEVRTMKCVYYMERHLPKDSLRSACRQVLSVEPDNEVALNLLLVDAVERNDHNEGLRLCKEGRLYYPRKTIYYYYEGYQLFRMNRNAEAISLLENGITRIDPQEDPETLSEFYALLGDIYHDERHDDYAFGAFEEALKHNPDNAVCLNNYAYYLSLAGKDLDKAQKLSRRAVDSEPNVASYLDTYAWILYLKREYTEARTYIDLAIQKMDAADDPVTYYDHAGDIYYHNGLRAEALDFWKKALSHATDKAKRRTLRTKVARRRP